MATYLINPTCSSSQHIGKAARNASPAVAIVRQRVRGARWAVRCRPCLQQLQPLHAEYDVAYLHGHHPVAPADHPPGDYDQDRPPDLDLDAGPDGR